jgi:hypothetical protein
MDYNLMRGFFGSIVGALTLTSPPLYRYPYRNAMEAFRSDWKHIGGDMDAAHRHFGGEGDGNHE